MRTKSQDNRKAKGFRLLPETHERLEFLKYRKVAPTFGEIIDKAVAEFHAKHVTKHDTEVVNGATDAQAVSG